MQLLFEKTRLDEFSFVNRVLTYLLRDVPSSTPSPGICLHSAPAGHKPIVQARPRGRIELPSSTAADQGYHFDFIATMHLLQPAHHPQSHPPGCGLPARGRFHFRHLDDCAADRVPLNGQ